MWKDIIGYEGIYQVSDIGQVKRISPSQGTRPNKILSINIDNLGYLYVGLSKNKICKTYRIHRLVLLAFGDQQPSSKHECRHLDGCRTNNKYTNLSWGTRQENMQDAIKHGTATIGTKNANAKFTKNNIEQIRRLLSNGISNTSIAKQFNVSNSIISDIKLGKSYRDI